MPNESNTWACSWVDQASPEDYIVVSSRIRLARNLVDYPFPMLLTEAESKSVINTVHEALPDSSQLQFQRMAELSKLTKRVLVEKHLISPQFATIEKHETALLTDDLGIVSIMINEEDHLRLQAITPGRRLQEAYSAIESIDEMIACRLNYAYDAELGYLTSCPTNLGTGMRASVMLHLPALLQIGNLKQIFNDVGKLGLVARGIYGENSGSVGAMYQISNQVTLGRSEAEIIAGLDSVIARVVEQERQARAYLVANFRVDVEDRIGRAWGILEGARTIGTEEAMTLLSAIRYGSEQQLVVEFPPAVLNDLMLRIQPACLQYRADKMMNSQERDFKRAAILRESLKI